MQDLIDHIGRDDPIRAVAAQEHLGPIDQEMHTGQRPQLRQDEVSRRPHDQDEGQ